MNVLLLDANLQSTLALTRSLGAAGIRVICGAEHSNAMAMASRYCTRSFVYTSPLEDQAAFIEEIRRVGKEEGRPLIAALSDKTFLALFKARDDLKDAVQQFLPDDSSVATVFDKQKTVALANDIDMPVPHTVRLYAVVDLAQYRGPFPVVVKPRSNVVFSGMGGVRQHVRMASNEKELRSIVAEMDDASGELPVLQEYVEGKEYGVFALARHGRSHVWFAHERIRSLHAYGGASVVRKSIVVPNDMKRWSEALVERLSWTGPVMIEFKRDAHSGAPMLMEINGRFWGSLPLTIAAGVNFPLLWYRMARGETVSRTSYKEGIVARHFLGDIHHLFSVFGARRIAGVSYPKRLATVGAFIRDLFDVRIRSDVASWVDPKPFFAELYNVLRRR